MRRKHETRCWLCGSSDLKPDGKGMTCDACGATYNVVPAVTAQIIAPKLDQATGDKSSSPSGTALAHQDAQL